MNMLGLTLADPAVQDEIIVDLPGVLHMLLIDAVAAGRCSAKLAVPGRESCARAAAKGCRHRRVGPYPSRLRQVGWSSHSGAS